MSNDRGAGRRVSERDGRRGPSQRRDGAPLGPVELRAWMGALHCVSVEDFAQLLDRRCDTVRHWLAGSKTPSPALREDLREIEAGIEDGARAAVEDGEAVVPVGNPTAAAIAARALILAARNTPPILVEVVPVAGTWVITAPDGTETTMTTDHPNPRTWAARLLGHPPVSVRCTPSPDRLPPNGTARLVTDGTVYTILREI